MATYCTADDLIAAAPYLAVSDLTPADGSVTATDKRDAAIADASATIDMYIGGRYTLPLASTPDEIKYAAVTLGVCNVLRMSAARSDELRNWELKYERIMRWLEAVAAGKISIYSLQGVDTQGGIVTNFTDKEHRFTDDKRSGGRSLSGLSWRPARTAG